MQICVDTRGAKLYAGTGIGTYTARLLENIMSIDDRNSYTFFWPNEGYEFMQDKENISVTLFGEWTFITGGKGGAAGEIYRKNEGRNKAA